jgi:hypothetical protein
MHSGFKFLITLQLLLLSSIHIVGAEKGKYPERIILNLTEKPETSMAVSWRTRTKTNSSVCYARAGDWIEFGEKADTVLAECNRFITDAKDTVYHYSAVINGLKPGTLYAYRVGNEDEWSEWNHLITANRKVAPFKFVFFGDPQNHIKKHCSRLFRTAYKLVPDAAFWLFAGDLISEPEDWQYKDFFYAAGFIFRTTPSIMAPGNHDRAYLYKNGKIVLDEKNDKERIERVAEEWRNHFTLPQNGPVGYDESSYYIDYQGVRFIMIDTNDEEKLNEQASWVDSLLDNNPNSWTIASFHHPFYSIKENRDNHDTRNAFGPIFDKHHVDLVLTGHDHAYSRSYKLFNNQKVEWNEPGTVYVVSVSGPKMYKLNSTYNHLMAKTGAKNQLFQVIAVDSLELEYTAYTVTGTVYDQFTLDKFNP